MSTGSCRERRGGRWEMEGEGEKVVRSQLYCKGLVVI